MSPRIVSRIVWRELTTTMRRPGWILSTLLLPLLPLLGVAAEGLIQPERLLRGGSGPARVAFVDHSHTLDPSAFTAEPAPGGASPGARPPALEGEVPDTLVLLEDEAEARARLFEDGPRALTAVVIVPVDFLERGAVTVLRVEEGPGLRGGALGPLIRRGLRRGLLSGRLPEPVLRRVLEGPSAVEEEVIGPDGRPSTRPALDELVRRTVVPMVVATLLTLAIFLGAGYLLLGLSEEKENRILELLLATVSAEELLAGKLLGIGGAGLVQFALWLALLLFPARAALPLVQVGTGTALWALAFFLGGYLLFGALMLAIAAVADTARHAQQLSAVVTLVAAAPLIAAMPILQTPHAGWVRALTLFPLTAPITALLRLPAVGVPTWELALALGGVLGGAAGGLVLAARLLRSALWIRFSLRAWLGRWMARRP